MNMEETLINKDPTDMDVLLIFLITKNTPASVKLQNRFCIETGFAPSIATKLDLSQNGSIQNLHSIKY